MATTSNKIWQAAKHILHDTQARTARDRVQKYMLPRNWCDDLYGDTERESRNGSNAFAKRIRENAACTIRCAEGFHQGGEQLHVTVKGYAWFGSVKYAVGLAQRGRAFVGQIKSNHSLFPKKYIEDKLKEAPGGTHIVLKATFQDVNLIAIRYRYSSK